MSREQSIPAHHRAAAAAAVKALLGERAIVREMVEVPPGTPLKKRAVALQAGVRTFWSRWTGRQAKGRPGTDETQD